jgi:ribosomal protein S18 acetylase RimI-like enzyme
MPLVSRKQSLIMKKTPHSDSNNLRIRTAAPSDHAAIMAVMPDWWGGRDIRASLPKVFLMHFWNTSFIMENDRGEMIGFLIGFLSPANDREAYIHFAGIHPNYRRQGLGEMLFKRFFELSRENGRMIVRSCTSPVNKGSIAFHTRMGFAIEQGDGVVDGTPVTLDYNRPGDPKVLFIKHLV